jgi:hypothetical protein
LKILAADSIKLNELNRHPETLHEYVGKTPEYLQEN